MAQRIDGRALARRLDETTSAEVEAMIADGMQRPGLAVILVGEDPASQVYVRRKIKACERVGINSMEYRLPADTPEADLLALIDKLDADQSVHGILCQVPLPQHIDTREVMRRISPDKDVDGFHPVNVGRLSTGSGGIVPCTPLGVMMLLESVIDDFVGLDAVVIGKSNIVGKPVANLLLDAECTVSVAHIHTEHLPEMCRKADIIVAAAGAPELVRGDWVKPGAVIIDVGITRIPGDTGKDRLVGDVAFDEVQHARAVTPVPGGVGPMTIACLLANTVKAAKALQQGEDADESADYHDIPAHSLFPQRPGA